MNRRTFWVFLVPVLIAIALGPTVTTVTTGLRESRVLVSATPLLDEPLVHELLVSLEYGERVQGELRCDTPDRWQRITVGELTLQDHGDYLVAKLPINGLAVVPGRIHAAGRSGASLHYCSRTPGPHCPGRWSLLAVRGAYIPADRCTDTGRQ